MPSALIQKITTKDHHLAQFRHYEILVNVFVVVLLISNLVATKIVAIGEMRFSGALLLFPITYIFGDIFTEVYGYAGSRRAIWVGFFASVLMAVISGFIVRMPAAPEWPHQQAFEIVLGVVPRNVVASLIAFWAGEFTNSYVMAKMKVWSGGKMLWTRTIGSTVAGQAVDTMLVVSIIFAGSQSTAEIVRIIWSSYLAKVLYEAAATPLTYLIVNWLKRAEGVDVFDAETDFNPFAAEKAPASAQD